MIQRIGNDKNVFTLNGIHYFWVTDNEDNNEYVKYMYSNLNNTMTVNYLKNEHIINECCKEVLAEYKMNKLMNI